VDAKSQKPLKVIRSVAPQLAVVKYLDRSFSGSFSRRRIRERGGTEKTSRMATGSEKKGGTFLAKSGGGLFSQSSDNNSASAWLRGNGIKTYKKEVLATDNWVRSSRKGRGQISHFPYC